MTTNDPTPNVLDEDGIHNEVKVEETKPVEDVKVESKDEVVEVKKDEPIIYDLKLSEESSLDPSVVTEIKEFAEKNKISKEAAQEILTSREKTLENYLAKVESETEKQIVTWGEEVLNDPVMGGQNFETTKTYALNVLNKYGDDSLREILRESGYGNNPHVVRFLYKLGKSMASDSLVMPKTTGSQEKPIEDYFYGTSS